MQCNTLRLPAEEIAAHCHQKLDVSIGADANASRWDEEKIIRELENNKVAEKNDARRKRVAAALINPLDKDMWRWRIPATWLDAMGWPLCPNYKRPLFSNSTYKKLWRILFTWMFNLRMILAVYVSMKWINESWKIMSAHGYPTKLIRLVCVM